MRGDAPPNDPYRAAAQFADRLELELRRLGKWQAEILPEAAFVSREAFCSDTMTFFQWLQHVLANRLRTIVAEKGQFPANSQVGVYARHALDGHRDASKILSLLSDLDDFIESVARQPQQAAWSAERYLDAVRARDRERALEFLTEASDDYEFPDGGHPVQSADYTVLRSALVDGDWQVQCHALLRRRSGTLVERRFVLCLTEQDGAMLVDLARSAAGTKEHLADRIIAINEKSSEAGEAGDIEKMKALMAEAHGLIDESDLELSGLGFDFDEAVEDEEVDDEEIEELDEEETAPAVETEQERRAFFHELTARFWRARTANDGSAAAMECESPIHPTGFDVTRAEGIWDSATAFHETLDDTGEWSGGVTVRTMVESNRGPFVILTAFLQEGAIWRVDHTTSLNATTHWWLRLYGNPHPFPNETSPRNAAMNFWYHVQMHSPQRAMEYVVPESRQRKIPKIGSGEVSEFFFYLDQKEETERAKAMVRVLINTAELVRIVHTPLVLREGEWLVDLPRVLRQLPSAGVE